MDTSAKTVIDDRTIASAVHLGGILLLFVPSLIAFVLLDGSDSWLREQLRAALNFQLTVLAAYLVGFSTLWLVVGFLAVPAIAAASVVLCILAALSASRGEPARYVFSLPFVG